MPCFRDRLLTRPRNGAAVDSVLEEDQAPGAKLPKIGQEAFRGGYSGYFSSKPAVNWRNQVKRSEPGHLYRHPGLCPALSGAMVEQDSANRRTPSDWAALSTAGWIALRARGAIGVCGLEPET
jgi:hypothetical protein